MAGAGQAFDVMKGLEDLKLMRQTHEENAKMSTAKNKLLAAQAEQAGLTADYMARVQQQKLDEEMARLKHNAAKAKLDEGLLGKRSAVEEKKIDQEGFNADTLAMTRDAGRGHAIEMQPLLFGTEKTNAMIARDTALGNQGRLQDVIGVADAKAKQDLISGRGNLAREGVNQGNLDMASTLKFGDLASQIADGQSRESRAAEVSIAKDEATTTNLLAEAAKRVAESTPEYIAEKRKIAETNALVQRYTQLEALVNSTGKNKVMGPDDVPVELGQLFDLYYDFDAAGNATPKDQDSWFRATKNLTANQKLDLERYKGQKMLSKMLGNKVGEAYGAPAPATQSQPKTTFILQGGRWVPSTR
jgi:hypothetical protein